MRCAGAAVSSSSRSSDRARCAPRFVPASAWISSTMTVSTPRSVSRAADVSMRNRDSGVVMRISGGWRHERPALGGQRVARADPDAHLGHLHAVRGRRARDADERGAQVALDVDAERLQRREVDDLGAGGRGIRPGRVQPVDRPEEGGEGLARAGGRDDQRVLAACDRLPGLALHGRGLGEGLGEPRPGRGRERVQRLGHPPIQPDAADARPGSAFSERPRARRRAPGRRRRRCGAPARHPSASCSPRTAPRPDRASATSSRAPRPRPRAAR